MPLFDLPLDQLRAYQPEIPEPGDFDAFWQRSLTEAAAHPLAATFRPLDDALFSLVNVYDVTYRGFGGQAIRAWLLEPRAAEAPRPCLVSYVGYGGGRGLPVDHLAPVAAGFVHFVMDTRGQGSGWSTGDTPDEGPADPQFPGFLTRGIRAPESYYYRRVFVDAARAVEAAAAFPGVDAARVAVGGASQGGGIAIAAAALAAPQVKALLADVPFLCHFRRASELVDTLPYNEIVQYLRCHRTRTEETFATLAYFDGVNFAKRVKAASLFSVGLMDMTCPPSTVFAAYNHVPAEKRMCTYAYSTHEGGGSHHVVERLRFLRERL